MQPTVGHWSLIRSSVHLTGLGADEFSWLLTMRGVSGLVGEGLIALMTLWLLTRSSAPALKKQVIA